MTTPEQIEAAARALWNHGKNTGTWNWEHVSEDTRVRYRAEATAALTAAYPLIEASAKAEALREAAHELRREATSKPGSISEVSSRFYAAWLLDRAATIEGKSE